VDEEEEEAAAAAEEEEEAAAEDEEAAAAEEEEASVFLGGGGGGRGARLRLCSASSKIFLKRTSRHWSNDAATQGLGYRSLTDYSWCTGVPVHTRRILLPGLATHCVPVVTCEWLNHLQGMPDGTSSVVSGTETVCWKDRDWARYDGHLTPL